MNGVLAWSEGMGMPMRPLMSVMEELDVPPVTARDAGLAVTIGGADDLRPGVPTTLTIEVRDAGPNGTGYGAGCPPTCGDGDEAPFLRQGFFLP